ncbi:helix-turn-helix transcriptional regulator [Opitutus terrae]|uniref:Transcriptional regulator, AraC family n=1 Tax=Opitutus terrae (strain DSM 11246 / JCM 15787 / PB90-1) TaxID=452637 RepID=B1ZXB4_OPITP|nr:AraC family transcriptional regulator [Opitutus terrae]ACB76166.1 transcriptional regulator, AraC family [Opitutus terrae PB90-1]
MKHSTPLPIILPRHGVLFAESVHDSGFHMAERTDPFHKLIYVLAGEVSFHESGRPVSTVGAGSLIVTPQLTCHAIDDVSPATLLLLCFADSFLRSDPDLAQLWTGLTDATSCRLCLARPSQLRLERLWRQALLEQAHELPGSPVAIRALAAQIFVMLLRVPARPGGDTAPQRVAAVGREIRETFYNAWDLDGAAARAGLSRRRFSALFRAEFNETFSDYLLRLRLDHAARLLRTREHSVMGVMFSCGFNDLSHFYRLFRARFGSPPKRWVLDQAPAPVVGSPHSPRDASGRHRSRGRRR